MLQYDDNGFYFFLLSSLSFYLIPCKLVMLRMPLVHLPRQTIGAESIRRRSFCCNAYFNSLVSHNHSFFFRSPTHDVLNWNCFAVFRSVLRCSMNSVEPITLNIRFDS